MNKLSCALIFLCIASDALAAPALTLLPVTPAGIGKLKIGMTLQQVEKASGFAIKLDQEPGSCNTAIVDDGNLGFLFQNGALAMVTVFENKYATLENIRVGDDEKKLEEIYQNRLFPQESDMGNERYIRVDMEKKSGYVFFTDVEGKIFLFNAGLYPAVELKEGCPPLI